MSAKEAPRIKWLVEPKFDEDGVQATAGLDQFSREHGDPVPMSPPVGLSVAQGDELHTAIRNLFLKERAAFRAVVEAEEFESEEEANDFLTEDELYPPGSEPWEDIFEFPVQEPGVVANGPTLASGAVKGESPQQDGAPPVATSQTASADLVSESSGEKMAERQSSAPRTDKAPQYRRE